MKRDNRTSRIPAESVAKFATTWWRVAHHQPGRRRFLTSLALAAVVKMAGSLVVCAAESVTPAQIAADREFTRVANYGDLAVWRKPVSDGSLLVSLANNDKVSVREVTAFWADLGLSPEVGALVTDSTGREILGRFVTTYTAPVKPGSVDVVRIVPDKPEPAVPDRQVTASTIAAMSKKPLNARRLVLDSSAPTGALIERGYSGTPDAAGVLARYAIDVPAYAAGCYFGDNFPIMGNTTGPTVFGDSLAGLSYGGLFLLLQLKDGSYLAVLPVAGPLAFSWLEPTAGGLVLDVGTRGTAEIRGDLPLVAWARASDPYAACAQAWETALQIEQIRGRVALRRDKTLPEYFHYLGWCSWEQFRHNISEEILSRAFSDIKASGLPVRWALIDDGHVANRDNQYISFQPNENFPRGFAPLIAQGRKNGIHWFGLWQHMSGYGGLIDPQNDLGLDEHLREVYISRNGRVLRALLPKSDRGSAEAFFSGLIGPAKKAGFDFVKIDFQGYHFNSYTGTENPVGTVQLHYQVVEEICHDSGLIFGYSTPGIAR